ncbi:Hypothetical predicted protein [Pelobates cultripes]|uniref:Uncharacterized protein n=1 Tax=Pelobates cultripes TaxID=61616 RepID=A0AAD1RFZ2_PELCU|nr:Hypothetical predicted protein [Pelobates cultripes]
MLPCIAKPRSMKLYRCLTTNQPRRTTETLHQWLTCLLRRGLQHVARKLTPAQSGRTHQALRITGPSCNPLEDSSNATLQSLAEVKGFLAAEIAHMAKEVKAKIHAIGVHSTVIEKCMAHVVTAHNGAATLTNKLLHRITDLELELEDVSNRSQRNNLRVRGLPESVSDTDIEATLITCFRQSLPDIPEHLWLTELTEPSGPEDQRTAHPEM